jgi:hypothetical protein
VKNLEVAHWLIDSGIPPAPLSAVDKTPLTAHGFKDRTIDRARVNECAARWPGCLWGFVPSDIDALFFDVDTLTTQYIADRLGVMKLATYRTITPGGIHIGCRNVSDYVGGARISLSDVGASVPPNGGNPTQRVVVRADRGYLVAPGCIRADGGRYSQRGTFADLLPLPDSVAYLLEHRSDPTRDRGQSVTARSRDRGDDEPSVIAAFNRAHDVGAMLKTHGYKRCGKRWIAPDSETGLPGVVLLKGRDGVERVYSHHGSDALADDHAHDPFDLYRILVHKGDVLRAVRGAAIALGLAYPSADAAVRPMRRGVVMVGSVAPMEIGR